MGFFFFFFLSWLCLVVIDGDIEVSYKVCCLLKWWCICAHYYYYYHEENKLLISCCFYFFFMYNFFRSFRCIFSPLLLLRLRRFDEDDFIFSFCSFTQLFDSCRLNKKLLYYHQINNNCSCVVMVIIILTFVDDNTARPYSRETKLEINNMNTESDRENFYPMPTLLVSCVCVCSFPPSISVHYAASDGGSERRNITTM